jgi:hypothetical protein
MRIESLTMAGQTGIGIQIRLKKIRPRPHLGKDDEVIKPLCHVQRTK